MCRAVCVQVLQYMQGFVCPALYARLYSLCTIRSTIHRAKEDPHYTQGHTGPTLYAGVNRLCTIHKAAQALNCTQGSGGPSLYIRRSVLSLHYM